jgi:eukaryotic-like serine/threonine-protein kinase
MFLNSSAGGTFHIWRQRFPSGQPEQITSGPTEQEGIAMAPDGRSFITSVGSKQSSVWLHSAGGDRQVSLEGYSYDPKFTPDGKKLCYRILKGALPVSDASELRMVDLDSGRNEPLLPGFAVVGGPGLPYDISPDGRQVVATVRDENGKFHLWLAPLDQGVPPHEIPNVEGQQPKFGPGDEIFFRAFEGASAFAFKVRQDGTGLRKVFEQPIATILGLSRDGKWLVLEIPGKAGTSVAGLPLAAGLPVPIYTRIPGSVNASWSADGRQFLISIPTAQMLAAGRTYILPLPLGRIFPSLPPGGFQAEAEIAKVPGARLINAYDAAAGRETYAFARQTVQRNLFRIPLP